MFAITSDLIRVPTIPEVHPHVARLTAQAGVLTGRLRAATATMESLHSALDAQGDDRASRAVIAERVNLHRLTTEALAVELSTLLAQIGTSSPVEIIIGRFPTSTVVFIP